MRKFDGEPNDAGYAVTLSGPQFIAGAILGAALLTYSLVYGFTEKPTRIDLERAALESPSVIGELALCPDQLSVEASRQLSHNDPKLPSATEYNRAATLARQLHIACTEAGNVITARLTIEAGTGKVTNAQLLPAYYKRG